MSEDEEKQKLSTRLEYILNLTAIIPIFFLLFFVRPEGGYLQRIEFILFLIQYDNGEWDGLLLENIFNPAVTSLLPLLIIIPLMFYRERVSAGINNFMIAQITKEVIEEFDKDSDEILSKEKIIIHKTRRQTHSMCIECGIAYLTPKIIPIIWMP